MPSNALPVGRMGPVSAVTSVCLHAGVAGLGTSGRARHLRQSVLQNGADPWPAQVSCPLRERRGPCLVLRMQVLLGTGSPSSAVPPMVTRGIFSAEPTMDGQRGLFPAPLEERPVLGSSRPHDAHSAACCRGLKSGRAGARPLGRGVSGAGPRDRRAFWAHLTLVPLCYLRCW